MSNVRLGLIFWNLQSGVEMCDVSSQCETMLSLFQGPMLRDSHNFSRSYLPASWLWPIRILSRRHLLDQKAEWAQPFLLLNAALLPHVLFQESPVTSSFRIGAKAIRNHLVSDALRSKLAQVLWVSFGFVIIVILRFVILVGMAWVTYSCCTAWKIVPSLSSGVGLLGPPLPIKPQKVMEDAS